MTRAAQPDSLAATVPEGLSDVERAIGELRRGAAVLLEAAAGNLLVQSIERLSIDNLDRLQRLAQGGAQLVVTGRRAAALGALPPFAAVMTCAIAPAADPGWLRDLADPLAERSVSGSGVPAFAPAPDGSAAVAGIELAKLARLLPAIVAAPLDPVEPAAAVAGRENVLRVSVAAVMAFRTAVGNRLVRVSDAPVPLHAAEQTRLIAFRPVDGGSAHLAVVVGAPPPGDPVLTRLHSACITGDLLGSLRCDCGDQLRGALDAIAQAGGGILLYLAQEGRGIGIVNKLRAYRLQDLGFDTIEADDQLGFEPDERSYAAAAEMLRQLGYRRVRLLTNNPAKLKALEANGIDVTARVSHAFPANPHNAVYLQTKRTRGGHLF